MVLYVCKGCNFETSHKASMIYHVNRIKQCSNFNLQNNEEKYIVKKDLNIPKYKESFAISHKVKYWSSDNILKPFQVYISSGKKFWFICEFKHKFETSPANINRNIWCPYPCCCKSPKLCDDEECLICLKSSVAGFPEIMSIWSSTNTINPRKITRYANKQKCIFRCKKGGHLYEATLNNLRDGDLGCPYPCCCHSPKLCDDLTCKICENESCIYLKEYWSSKNEQNFRFVSKSSMKMCFFICKNGHEFEMKPNSINYDKQWCPLCRNKTETKIYEYLCLEFKKENIKRQIRFKETNRYFFDFLLFDNIIIECDGPQHFIGLKSNSIYSMTNKETLERDIYKMEKIIDLYSIIRLFQPDIFDDKYDWKSFIKKTVNFIKIYKSKKLYISKNNFNIYNNHTKHFQTIIF